MNLALNLGPKLEYMNMIIPFKTSTTYGHGSVDTVDPQNLNFVTGSVTTPILSGSVERAVQQINDGDPVPQGFKAVGRYDATELETRIATFLQEETVCALLSGTVSFWSNNTERFIPKEERNSALVIQAMCRIVAYLLMLAGQSSGLDDESATIVSTADVLFGTARIPPCVRWFTRPSESDSFSVYGVQVKVERSILRWSSLRNAPPFIKEQFRVVLGIKEDGLLPDVNIVEVFRNIVSGIEPGQVFRNLNLVMLVSNANLSRLPSSVCTTQTLAASKCCRRSCEVNPTHDVTQTMIIENGAATVYFSPLGGQRSSAVFELIQTQVYRALHPAAFPVPDGSGHLRSYKLGTTGTAQLFEQLGPSFESKFEIRVTPGKGVTAHEVVSTNQENGKPQSLGFGGQRPTVATRTTDALDTASRDIPSSSVSTGGMKTTSSSTRARTPKKRRDVRVTAWLDPQSRILWLPYREASRGMSAFLPTSLLGPPDFGTYS